MATRRQLLATTGFVGATTLLAGCSGGEQSPNSEEESTESESTNTSESESVDVLPNFSLGEITFSYGFSSGLSATIELTNETEKGSGVNTANIAMKAYEGDELVGEDNQWKDIQATITGEYELVIEALAQDTDTSLEDASEIRILGQEENQEPVELEIFSGDTIRSRLED